ncbi:MAG TPA: metal transporter, partial [Promineifilum sp.]|nr:metal transporter [Promineifilum sp.]
MNNAQPIPHRRASRWLLALLPLALLVLLVVAFLALDPLRFFQGAFPPLEELSVQRVVFPDADTIRLEVINSGPEPVTIAQVAVDNAYWNYTIHPDNTLGRLETATIDIPYRWVAGEPLPINLITSTGLTFPTAVDVAVESASFSGRTL